MTRVEVFVDTQDRLGEGPIWWKAKDVLAWVDILDGEIHVADWNGNHLETIRMPEPVGFIFEQPNGRLIAGCRSGFRTVPDGDLILPLPPSPHPIRINDGKIDPQGRVVFGTMGYPKVETGAGTLWRYDGNTLVALRTELTIPNGLDWIDEGQTVLFVDTPTRTIQSAAYPNDERLPRDWRVWTDLSGECGHPDGLVVSGDEIYVAMWGGSQIIQISQHRLTRMNLKLPVAFPTSVAQHPHNCGVLVTSARPQKSSRNGGLAGTVLLLSPR